MFQGYRSKKIISFCWQLSPDLFGIIGNKNALTLAKYQLLFLAFDIKNKRENGIH